MRLIKQKTQDKSSQEAMEEINKVLEAQDKELSGVRLSKIGSKDHISFSVAVTRSERQDLLNAFRQCDALTAVQASPGSEVD